MGKLRSLICLVFVVSGIAAAVFFVKAKMVEDNTPPVITCEEEEIEISVEDGESALLEGIKATDNRDGDLTDSVRIASMSHFINGKRNVTYAVFDHSNLVGTLQRTVTYSDYKSPRIYMKKPLRFLLTNSDEINFEGYFEAKDCLDGDISNQVRPIMDNNYYGVQEGIFEVTLQVSNSAGDVCSVPVEMQIAYSDDEEEQEKEYPVLSDYIVYTKVGKSINEEKYLEGISRGNTEYHFEDSMLDVSESDIKIKSKVDYDKAGVYTVEYSYKASEAPKAVTKLYVVVEEK